jgi:hypothetical protein
MGQRQMRRGASETERGLQVLNVGTNSPLPHRARCCPNGLCPMSPHAAVPFAQSIRPYYMRVQVTDHSHFALGHRPGENADLQRLASDTLPGVSTTCNSRRVS